jgi:hypothetical protein
VCLKAGNSGQKAVAQAASRGFQCDSEAMKSHEVVSLMRLRLLRDEEKGLIRVSLEGSSRPMQTKLSIYEKQNQGFLSA